MGQAGTQWQSEEAGQARPNYQKQSIPAPIINQNRKERTIPMKTGDVYSGSYLKAEHLQGRSVRVTINHVTVEEFEQGDKVEKKIVLGFQGKDKMLVVNKTNAAIITDNLGTDETDNWIGQTITLTVKKVEYAGKLVPAIRVMLNDGPTPAKPTTAAPEQAPANGPGNPGKEESLEVPF